MKPFECQEPLRIFLGHDLAAIRARVDMLVKEELRVDAKVRSTPNRVTKRHRTS